MTTNKYFKWVWVVFSWVFKINEDVCFTEHLMCLFA